MNNSYKKKLDIDLLLSANTNVLLTTSTKKLLKKLPNLPRGNSTILLLTKLQAKGELSCGLLVLHQNPQLSISPHF